MADARPFRGLRYTARVDLADVIAPPYDVISERQQRELYDRSPHNVVRIEYGQERAGDSESESRYTRAAGDLQTWVRDGVLAIDGEPAMYAYTQSFTSGGRPYERNTWFVALRLEEWERGIVKPHEHTLSNPKADRLKLLRATRTQISPVYCVVRGETPLPLAPLDAEPVADFAVDDQHHVLRRVTDATAIAGVTSVLKDAGVYIADGHHRYETALAYRAEVRDGAASWTGEEPENFILVGLTDVADPGLVVLPTHRMIYPPSWPENAIERLGWHFEIEDLGHADVSYAAGLLKSSSRDATTFVAVGLAPGALHMLTLKDRPAVEHLMPAGKPAAWKKLDVNVLQYGVLLDVFGIDEPMLTAGGHVMYTQDAAEASAAVRAGKAQGAFLLNATPVRHVLAVADAGARMPQKSTYFYPKLPTGLVMRSLDG